MLSRRRILVALGLVVVIVFGLIVWHDNTDGGVEITDNAGIAGSCTAAEHCEIEVWPGSFGSTYITNHPTMTEEVTGSGPYEMELSAGIYVVAFSTLGDGSCTQGSVAWSEVTVESSRFTMLRTSTGRGVSQICPP
jgi:hypothetical protein